MTEENSFATAFMAIVAQNVRGETFGGSKFD